VKRITCFIQSQLVSAVYAKVLSIMLSLKVLKTNTDSEEVLCDVVSPAASVKAAKLATVESFHFATFTSLGHTIYCLFGIRAKLVGPSCIQD